MWSIVKFFMKSHKQLWCNINSPSSPRIINTSILSYKAASVRVCLCGCSWTCTAVAELMLVYFTLQTTLQDGAWRCFFMSPGSCGTAMVSFFSAHPPENWSGLVCEGGYCCLWTRGSQPPSPPPQHMHTLLPGRAPSCGASPCFRLLF